MAFPINFKSADVKIAQGKALGVGVAWYGPPPPKYWTIGGVTRDSAGAVAASCTVDLYLTATKAKVDSVLSDAQGNYAFRSAGPAEQYFAVAYKAGAPDIFGTTLNTLIGV